MANRAFDLRDVIAVSNDLVAHSKRLIHQGNTLLHMAQVLDAHLRNIVHAKGLADALEQVRGGTRRLPQIPRAGKRPGGRPTDDTA